MKNGVWVERAPTDVTMPASLRLDEQIYYRLAGDPDAHGPQRAGGLFWGMYTGPEEVSERIVSYALAPAVPRPDASTVRPHAHYFKGVSHLDEVDVYRVLELFGVTDQALGHAIKKLLVAGGRGAGKDIRQDVAEAIDTLQRWQEMRVEDEQRRRVA